MNTNGSPGVKYSLFSSWLFRSATCSLKSSRSVSCSYKLFKCSSAEITLSLKTVTCFLVSCRFHSKKMLNPTKHIRAHAKMTVRALFFICRSFPYTMIPAAFRPANMAVSTRVCNAVVAIHFITGFAFSRKSFPLP